MRMSVSSWKQRHSKWWCLCPAECEDTHTANGTSAISFSTLEPNSHHLDNEGEITPHEIMYTLYSSGSMRWISSHLPPWDFPCWNFQTEFGVLALWLWIQAYSWQIAIPSNALATAYAKKTCSPCPHRQRSSSTVLHWLGILLNPCYFTFLFFLISR